jgi:AcrR family transcriptional regulator
MGPSRPEPSVRERLLEAANELFYQEGVHTVGIDRVLERAGVAKASLYGTFGSKDELVRAYLEERARRRRERISQRIAEHDDPRARILSVFDLLAETARETAFRGCAFVNACAEGPGGPATPARQVSSKHRAWVRDLFHQLATDLGARDPEQLARQLSLLNTGALIAAYMDSDPDAPLVARDVAERLLDAQAAGSAPTPPRAGPRKSSRKRTRRVT